MCLCKNMETERIRKQLYMSCRGFSSAQSRAWTNSWIKFTCKLWTKALPSAKRDVNQLDKIKQWSLADKFYKKDQCVKSISNINSPPVSLSSTRISNFNSLQGISGSSPITVKVASNSPSTRNFTRPLAT